MRTYSFNPKINVLENIEKMLCAASPLEMSLLRLQDKFGIYDEFCIMLYPADQRIIEIYTFNNLYAYTTTLDDISEIRFSGTDLTAHKYCRTKVKKLKDYLCPTFDLDEVKIAISDINKRLEIQTKESVKK